MGKWLAGVRVLDLSHYLPGPYCTLILSGLGASVTKVEPPHWRDPVRGLEPLVKGVGSLFRMLHRGKKLLRIDYTKAPGRRRLDALLAKSDVVIEGFRPGLMGRLGLGPDALLKRHPRLVYCSITGYGRTGHRWAGHDINYQALAGLLAPSAEAPAVMPLFPTADLAGSLYAALGIASALRRRELEGRGGLVDVSMTEAVSSLNIMAVSEDLAGTGRGWWRGGYPFYRLYRCRDGRFVSVGALEKRSAVWLLNRLGLGALESLVDRAEKHIARLNKAMERAFLKKTRDQWVRLLQEQDVCLTPVLSTRESLSLPHGGVFPPRLWAPPSKARSKPKGKKGPSARARLGKVAVP